MSITGARPLGVTNCLNYGDPTRPEAFWQLTEGVRGLGDACRALGLPVTGGNVSLYNESPAGAIAPDAGDRRRRAARRRRDARRPGLRGRRRRGPARRRGGARAWPGRAYAALAGAAAGGRPAGARPRPRGGRSRRSSARRSRRGLVASAQDVSGGGLAVALAECAIWGGLGAGVRVAGRALAGGRAVRREPVAPRRRRCRPRHAAGARRCSPASTACRSRRSASVGGDRLVIELAGAGATGAAEERGSRVADALEVPLARPAPRLGARPRRGPSAGRADRCAACSGPSCRGGEPTDAAALAALGLFALQHRGQESAGLAVSDGEQLMLYKDLGMISTVLDERRLPSLRGRPRDRPLPLLDDRLDDLGERPADATASGRGGRSRSATTATSSTPASCSSQLAGRPGAPARPRPTRSC